MADITREELATIIQEEYSTELLSQAVTNSAALQAFRRVDMGTKTQNLPVLATIPEAGFVSESATADEGKKPTAQATWGNKQLVAEEIAVIIPIHENTLDDATTDVLDELTKQGGAAIGRKLDGAVLFGTDKPVTWTSDDLMAAAIAASQTITIGNVADGDDLGGAILQAAELVDTAGWEPSDVLAPRGMRFRLANLRNVDGTPIFLPSLWYGTATKPRRSSSTPTASSSVSARTSRSSSSTRQRSAGSTWRSATWSLSASRPATRTSWPTPATTKAPNRSPSQRSSPPVASRAAACVRHYQRHRRPHAVRRERRR